MSVTVIISALNEPYLQHTIETLLHVSPRELLKEIIVVDDCNDPPLVANYERTRIIRNDERQGLIRSRNIAAREAKTDIVISMDAHCKAELGWLPPIYKKLKEDYKCIALPVTVNLNPELWENGKTEARKTGWKWNLSFLWRPNYSDDNKSPAMGGHCFGFTKEWWEHLGGLDDGMDKWGGENIEFPLRSWLAGGSVEVVEGSVVGHWFKGFWSYQMDHDTLRHNKARVAEVWFGDKKHMFYDAIGKKPGDIDFGDITEMEKIRDRCQVRSFDWFLKNLLPELAIVGLRNSCKDHNIVVLGSGPSLDDFDMSLLDAYDTVIGVNYNALIYDCDFVVFHDRKPAVKVLNSGKYKPEQLFVPIRLMEGKAKYASSDISCEWWIYTLGGKDKLVSAAGPPFLHHASTVHTAAHIAMFLGAKSVTLVGCDGKLAPDGSSHSTKIAEYNNGMHWDDDESTEKYLKRLECGYDMLRLIAKKRKVPLLNINYV